MPKASLTPDLAPYFIAKPLLNAVLKAAEAEQLTQVKTGKVRILGKINYERILSAMLEAIAEQNVKERVSAMNWPAIER